jgi:hypothetical protein
LFLIVSPHSSPSSACTHLPVVLLIITRLNVPPTIVDMEAAALFDMKDVHKNDDEPLEVAKMRLPTAYVLSPRFCISFGALSNP